MPERAGMAQALRMFTAAAQREPADAVQRSAWESEDRRFRYRLDRWWSTGPRLVFVMLNPSTADADNDDPTIRRCMSFARRDGFAGITVLNLYPYRATDPRDLVDAEAAGIEIAGGDEASAAEYETLQAGQSVVCAWGAHPLGARRGPVIIEMRHEIQFETMCLGRTKDGHPRHPLYVRGDQPLEVYP